MTADLPMAPPYPARCTNADCESDLLEWHLATRMGHGLAIMDGRLKMNDVVPRLYLSCEECGEMLGLVEDDGPLNKLLAPQELPPIEIKVQRPAEDNPLLAEALRYYTSRRSMGNPKGWAHVLRVLDRAVAAGALVGTEAQVDEARSTLTQLAATEGP
jgi:hypothetical protein